VEDRPCDRYCDDVFGIGSLLSAAHDASVVQSLIVQTFGKGSVAQDKSWLDQHAVILGWHIGFTRNLVRPSNRGIRKLAFSFFSVDVRAGQPLILTKWQELHSLAECYSDGLLCTSDFVQPLAAMLAGWEPSASAPAGSSAPKKHRRVKRLKTANSAARFAIEMWRIFSIRLWQNCDAYSMSIEQFSGFYDTNDLSPRVAISDSSTPRVAVAIYDNLPDGSLTLVAWTGYDYPAFGYTDNNPATFFQNQREYLGLLLALVLIAPQSTNTMRRSSESTQPSLISSPSSATLILIVNNRSALLSRPSLRFSSSRQITSTAMTKTAPSIPLRDQEQQLKSAPLLLSIQTASIYIVHVPPLTAGALHIPRPPSQLPQ